MKCQAWMVIAVQLVFVASCQRRLQLPRPVLPLELAPVSSLREQPPEVSQAIDGWQAPHVRHRMLNNGLEILVVERSQLPVVSVAVGVRAGSMVESNDNVGAACLAATLLNEGTEIEPGNNLRHMNIKGVPPEVKCHSQGILATFSRLSRDLPAALALAGALIQKPVFDQGVVARAVVDQLELRFSDSMRIENHLLHAVYSELYGTNQALGRDPSDVQKGLRVATSESVRRFHSRYYQPGRTVVVVVGAVSDQQAKVLVESEFGGWSDVVSVEEATTELQATPTIHNTQGFVGCWDVAEFAIAIPLVGHDHADYLPLRLIATLLGLLQTSRLSHELRYHRGATYSIDTTYSARDGSGELIITGDLENDELSSSLEFLQAELNRLGREALSSGELAAAKSALLGELASATYANDDLAELLARSYLAGHSWDHLEELAGAVAAIETSHVQAAASRHLHITRGAMAICGDPVVVNPALRGFGAIKWFELLAK